MASWPTAGACVLFTHLYRNRQDFLPDFKKRKPFSQTVSFKTILSFCLYQDNIIANLFEIFQSLSFLFQYEFIEKLAGDQRKGLKCITFRTSLVMHAPDISVSMAPII